MLYFVAFAVWCVLAIFTINNRFLRDNLYAPRFGKALTSLVALVLQLGAIVVVTWLLLAWVPGPHDTFDLWAVGVGWVVLSVLFDVVVVPSVDGTAWTMLLLEYDPRHGGVWVLVLATLLLAPPLVGSWLLPA